MFFNWKLPDQHTSLKAWIKLLGGYRHPEKTILSSFFCVWSTLKQSDKKHNRNMHHVTATWTKIQYITVLKLKFFVIRIKYKTRATRLENKGSVLVSFINVSQRCKFLNTESHKVGAEGQNCCYKTEIILKNRGAVWCVRVWNCSWLTSVYKMQINQRPEVAPMRL